MKFTLDKKYFQIAIIAVIALALITSVLGAFQINSALGNAKMMEHLFKDFGGNSRNLALLAMGFWIAKTGLKWAAKKKLPIVSIMKNMVLSLRQFHITVGIIALVIALIHSAYFLYVFLFVKADQLFTNITGIASVVFMLILSIFGIILWFKKKGVSRKWHYLFSLVFFGFFLAHWLLS